MCIFDLMKEPTKGITGEKGKDWWEGGHVNCRLRLPQTDCNDSDWISTGETAKAGVWLI